MNVEQCHMNVVKGECCGMSNESVTEWQGQEQFYILNCQSFSYFKTRLRHPGRILGTAAQGLHKNHRFNPHTSPIAFKRVDVDSVTKIYLLTIHI